MIRLSLKTKLKSLTLLILTSILLLNGQQAGAQEKFGVGLSGIYNFETEGIGGGLRVAFRAANRLSIVPQIQYFPAFNTVHEFFGGVNLHYDILYRGNLTAYLIAGGSANSWSNYQESAYSKAKAFNIIPEAGVGVTMGRRQLRPFAEWRYNPIWKEAALHVGVMYYPPAAGGHRRQNNGDCPAYK